MESQRSDVRIAEAEYRDQSVIIKKPETKQPWLWHAVAVVLFIADRMLKESALAGVRNDILPGFEFVLFKNKGIAFSLPLHETIFWALALPIFALLLWMFVSSIRKGDRFISIALLFIILGASSNLYDRFSFAATIDYFLFFSRSAVNIADGMIVGGVLAMIFRPKKG